MNTPSSRLALALVAAASLVSPSTRAGYNYFDIASGSDCIRQDYRAPHVPTGVYDCIHQDYATSSDGGSGYFYGGFTHQNVINGTTNTLVQYVCWPAGGSFPYSYDQQIPYFAGTNMVGFPQIAEGSSCCIKGYWPQFTTNLWTREAIRYWQPADGTPHVGYQGMWIKEPVSGNWYHVTTFKYPFAITGVTGIGGWQEYFAYGYGAEVDSVVDHGNGYFHTNGVWAMADQINYTAQGYCYLINTNTATESAEGPDYTNLYNVPITLTASAQPALPTFDPIVVSNVTASVYGTQLLVQWQMPLSSSPQLFYQVSVFTNASYTGTVVAAVANNDPEARQALLSLPSGITPYVSLTIADIFFQTNPPILITPTTATPSPATSVSGTVGGLAYQYYQNNSGTWGSLPNFSSLTPVLRGAVSIPDVTPRLQRTSYGFNYTGYLNAPTAGLYAFTSYSGDGSSLTIDGTNVVNFDGLHDSTEFKSGGMALAAGLHTFNLQFFKGAANPINTTAYTDGLGLSWQGPGFTNAVVPASAFARVPGGGEPAIALTSPMNSAVLANSSPGLAASITTNGVTVNSVQYYLTDFSSYYFRGGASADYCLGQGSGVSNTLNSMIWIASSNLVRARMTYNGTNTIDSAPVSIITTNTSFGPWLWTPLEMHNYPSGASIQNGSFSLLGDGMNLLSRAVSGDCTLIARLTGITPDVASPDGVYPNTSWRAGIILRSTTNSTIGQPLGNGSDTRFAAMFCSVGGGAYYENDTMRDGNGDANAWSADLGNYYWFKLVRSGGTNFSSYYSPDGTNWTLANTIIFTNFTTTTMYAGAFLYADQSLNPNLNYASFNNVSITGDILGPPGVTATPSAATNYIGQTCTFTALPSANAPFTYQWQYNSVNLTGATNSTLTLTNVQPASSGIYSVTLNNSNGTASATASLTVLPPPSGSSAYAAQVVSNNPYAYWRFSETSGTTAYDSIGAMNGTYASCTLGVAGPQPPAVPGFELTNVAPQFNGSSSSIGFGTTHSLNGPLNFTVLGWVKTTSSSSGVVIQQRDTAGYAGEYQLAVNGSGTVSFYVYNSTYQFSLTTPQAVNDGNWHLLAAQRTGTNGYIYVDGQLAVSGSSSAAVQNLTSTIATYIGYDERGGSTYFGGTMDEVAIFTNTLSAAAIQSLYQAATVASPSMITLTSPASGAAYGSPATINLSASVVTNGHSITSVQFYNGAALLGQSSTAPYGYVWTNVPAGAYTLYAQVTYDAGSTQASAPAFVTVSPLPSAPAAITPVALSGNLISVGWATGANASGYILSRNGTPIVSLAGTNYFDLGLNPSTTYAYSVVATNLYGNSPPSVTNSATTPGSGTALWWDANNLTTGPSDGNGNWGTSANTWWNGSANVTWANSALAILGNGPTTLYSVVLTNNVTPAGIIFNPNNGGSYSLASGGGLLVLSGTPGITCNGNATLSATLNGSGTVTLTGAGTLTITGGNTNTGAIVVNGGSLLATGGGWYDNRSIGSGALTVSNGAVAEFTQSHGFGESNGGEPVTINHGTLQLDGDNYCSGMTLTAATINGVNGHYLAPIGGMTCTVNASATLSTINTPALSLQGAVTFNVARGTGLMDLQVVGGAISGSSGSITKSGAGILQISSTATNSGTTTISAGTLQVDGALGTNTVSVGNNATLAGAGIIHGATTVSSGGTLAPGDAGVSGSMIGTLSFSNNLTLNSGSKPLLKVSKNGGVLSNDLVIVAGSLAFGGSLTVTNIGTNAFAMGDSFQVFSLASHSGGFSSLTLPALSTNLVWNSANLTNSGTLVVVSIPVITNQPQSLAVNPGSPASFTVGATGSGTLAYQWQLNGTNLAGAVTNVYALASAAATNAGNYTVIITNNYGAVTSVVAALAVNAAPLISSPPQSVTVYVNSNATFSVTAGGSPVPAYQWQFNGTNLAGATATNYVIAAANTNNEGNYTVVLTNVAGSLTSSVASLSLYRNFGCAPLPYPSLLASNGARHLIVPGFQLGVTNPASTDARTNTVSEGGITFATALQAGQPATVQVVASAAGYLSGWIDLNTNGSWGDAGEQVFTNAALSAGTNNLTLSVPATAVATTNTWARFRFSSATNLTFTGQTPDGEVEDLPLAISGLTLAYLAGANGVISGVATQTVSYAGSGTAVSAVPNIGYHFVNWSDGSTANPRTDANVTSNLTVTASFAINTYTLTYLAGANGTISGVATQAVSYAGSGSPVSAVANSGYAFTNWSDGLASATRMDANVTSNLTVTASFVSVTVTPPAILPGMSFSGSSGFSLTATGAVGGTCVLYCATNLASPVVWQPVQTNTGGTNGVYNFSDPQATNFWQRFYRLLAQ